MRLIDCHIENFGILNGQDHSFNSGLNLICLPNGSGKSTLAAFIRVMLYGFEESARDDFRNERKRYAPWQGGTYGGSLRFEVGGEVYILERTFGATAKKDSFSLRCERTNLEYDGFSPVPGEALFGLDNASFKRTVFISQADCVTESTDRINSRLGNLTAMSGDMDRFEAADGALNDLLNKLSPTRKTGSIYKLKDEIDELQRKAQGGASADAELEVCKAALEREEGELAELKRQQKALQNRQDKASGVNSLIDQKEDYVGIADEYSSRQSEYESVLGRFPAGVPDAAELTEAENNLSRINELRLKAAATEPSPEEYAELEELEKHRLPSSEEIDKKIAQWSRRTQLLSDISAAGPQLRQARLLCPAIIAVLTAILAVIAYFILGTSAAVVCAATGVILAAASLFIPQKRQSKSTRRDGTAELEEIDRELEAFFAGMGPNTDSGDIPDRLYRMRAEADRLNALAAKRRKFEEEFPREELSRAEASLKAFLNRYLPNGCDGAGEGLRTLRHDLDELNVRGQELERAHRKKEDFEAREDFAAIAAADPAERIDMTGLISELRAISDRISDAGSDIDARKRKFTELCREKDEIDSAIEELHEKKNLLTRETKRYGLLKETRSMLRQARESLTSRYMSPLLEGFRRYYSLMNGQHPEDFDIDANISLGIHESGQRRELRFQSQGRRDLAGICLRMAMIEAMYREEKPFVIFDDPFTNLDEARTRGGLDFLKEISDEYQILYFTCHSSRAK